MPGDSGGYTPLAKVLHWSCALLILGLLAVGLWMVGLPISKTKVLVFAWHKWLGLVVLLLGVLRLAWRWHAPPPALPGTITPWERRLAPFGHWALLVLLIAQPLDGWLMNSASGAELYWFAAIPLPDLVPRDPGLFKLLRSLHHWLAYALIGMVTLHVAAVIRHDVLRRDGVFHRMWFQAGRGPT
jgi:cytochrome b561